MNRFLVTSHGCISHIYDFLIIPTGVTVYLVSKGGTLLYTSPLHPETIGKQTYSYAFKAGSVCPNVYLSAPKVKNLGTNVAIKSPTKTYLVNIYNLLSSKTKGPIEIYIHCCLSFSQTSKKVLEGTFCANAFEEESLDKKENTHKIFSNGEVMLRNKGDSIRAHYLGNGNYFTTVDYGNARGNLTRASLKKYIAKHTTAGLKQKMDDPGAFYFTLQPGVKIETLSSKRGERLIYVGPRTFDMFLILSSIKIYEIEEFFSKLNLGIEIPKLGQVINVKRACITVALHLAYMNYKRFSSLEKAAETLMRFEKIIDRINPIKNLYKLSSMSDEQMEIFVECMKNKNIGKV